MANQADLDKLNALLPPNPKVGEDEWGEERLTLLLDNGNTVAQVMSLYWHGQAAISATYVDMSESGSSRSLGSIHKNAMDLAKYWDDRVKAEKDEEQVEENPRPRIAFHRITRV